MLSPIIPIAMISLKFRNKYNYWNPL